MTNAQILFIFAKWDLVPVLETLLKKEKQFVFTFPEIQIFHFHFSLVQLVSCSVRYITEKIITLANKY